MMFEPLESRQLLTIDITTPVPDAIVNRGSAATTINLANRYNDPAVSNLVQFITNSGTLNLALFGALAPNTVTNFLNYVTNGAYNGTIFHREQEAATDGIGILQGGSFRVPTGIYNVFPANAAATPGQVTTNAPIALEHPTGNVRGTIAMARTSVLNSATSSFFFNTTNNTAILDDATPGTPDAGYAVFGQLFPDSLAVLDALAAFQNTDFSGDFPAAIASNFGNLPLRKAPTVHPNTEVYVDFPIAPADYLQITTARVLNGISTQITVASSNTNVAAVTLDGTNLVITPVANATGTTTITITLTGADGTVATDTFDYTINNLHPSVAGVQYQRNVPAGGSMWINAAGIRDTDSTGGVTGVQFWYDSDDNGTLDINTDTLLGNDASADGGWRGVVSTTGIPAGARRFFTRVIDADGGATITSRVVTLLASTGATINPGTQTVAPGADADVTITGPGLPNSVRRVSLFIDTNGNGTFDPLSDRDLGDATYTGGQWTFRIRNTSLTGGLNTIFARVTGLSGQFGAIGAATVTVN